MTIVFIYFIFSLIVLLGFVEQQNITLLFKNNIKLSLLLLFVVFSGFRSPGFGSDDFVYIEMFKSIYETDCLDAVCGYYYAEYRIEIGFFLLLLFLTKFGVVPSILFSAVSAISISINWAAAKRLYPYLAPPVLLYFAHHFLSKEVNALRLSIAAAFVLYSGVCCVDRKYYKALFIVVFGAFFQVSSILAILPILLCYLLTSLRAITIFILAVIAASFLFPFYKVYEFLSVLDFVGNKIELYSASDEYNYAISILDPVNIKNFTVLALCIYFYKPISRCMPAYRVCLVFFMCATLIRYVFSDFAIIAGRGFGVISVFECFLIPALATHFFGKKLGYVAISIFSLSVLSLNIFVMRRWNGGVGYFGEYFF